MKTLTTQSTWFRESDLRLDASYHLSDGRVAKIKIENCPYEVSSLSDLTLDVFNGPRFKRYYVEGAEMGIPFMGSADMLKSDLGSLKCISKKLSRNVEALYIKKDWILVSCSGTIGNTVYTNEDYDGKTASQHIMRIVPNPKNVKPGYLYAFLSSKFGYALLTQGTYGAVIQHIEPHHIEHLPIPVLPEAKQQEIHDLITAAADLRVAANGLLEKQRATLKQEAGLADLTPNEYEYFGNHSDKRQVSTFARSINEVSAASINAFNYSRRVEKIEARVKQNKWFPLADCLDHNGFFSSGSFRRLELNSPTSIKLINQSDIFNTVKQGKLLARRYVKANKLAEYGEVLIAGVGTLGENETFCRAIFANEELENQLISGEFIRMKTNDSVPSGYLFAWLSSDYGFRLIRKTQSGTKLCRPIPALLAKLPVPILAESLMKEIDTEVKKAHAWMYEALSKELEAILLVETEIESWPS